MFVRHRTQLGRVCGSMRLYRLWIWIQRADLQYGISSTNLLLRTIVYIVYVITGLIYIYRLTFDHCLRMNSINRSSRDIQFLEESQSFPDPALQLTPCNRQHANLRNRCEKTHINKVVAIRPTTVG